MNEKDYLHYIYPQPHITQFIHSTKRLQFVNLSFIFATIQWVRFFKNKKNWKSSEQSNIRWNSISVFQRRQNNLCSSNVFPSFEAGARGESETKKWWPEGHLIFHSRVIYTLVTVRQLRLIGVSLLVTRPAHTLKEGPLFFRIKKFKIILDFFLFILKKGKNRKSQPTIVGKFNSWRGGFSLSFFFLFGFNGPRVWVL